jgi:hypothetical protein
LLSNRQKMPASQDTLNLQLGARRSRRRRAVDGPSKPKVAMSLSVDADCSDLAQASQLGQEVQSLIYSLLNYFSIKSLLGKDRWLKVKCSHESYTGIDPNIQLRSYLKLWNHCKS